MNEIKVRKSVIAVISTLILLGAAMGATSVGAQSADGEIAVSPTDVSLEQGESRTVAITYERLSDATPQGIEYTLSYDPDVISVTDQEQGSYLGGRALVNNISTPGETEYVEAIFDGSGVEKSSGTIATITIVPTSGAESGSTTDLEFNTAKASEAETEFAITTTPGTVKTSGSGQPDDNMDDKSGDGEGSMDDESRDEGSIATNEPQDGDADTAERTNGSSDSEINESETLSNRTGNINQDESIDTGETTNESSTSDNTEPETDTSESVPGFGITVAVLAILTMNYMSIKIRRR